MQQARALAREALDAWRGDNPDHAIDACDHALSLLLPVGPSEALADVLRWKGSVLRDRGDYPTAADLYTQSLTVADSIAYAAGRAHALNCLGTVAQYRGDLTAAERWLGEAARLSHRLGDRRLSAMVQQNLGIVADVQGRTDEAVAHFRLALAALEVENQRDAVLWVLNNLGVLYTREAAYARASEALERALRLAHELKDVASEGIVEENRAALFLATGHLDAADAASSRAFAIATRRHDYTRRAAAMRHLARARHAREGTTPRVVEMLEGSLALCQRGDDAQLRVEVLTDLGDAYRARADGRAKECWRRAIDLARLAGFEGMIAGLRSRLRPSASNRLPGISEATA